MTALALLTLNPFTGAFTGEYRAGFVNPKPITVQVQDDGTTHMSTPYQVLHGETDPSGTFSVSARGTRWDGSFTWSDGLLVGSFIVNGNPLVRGAMWLRR